MTKSGDVFWYCTVYNYLCTYKCMLIPFLATMGSIALYLYQIFRASDREVINIWPDANHLFISLRQNFHCLLALLMLQNLPQVPLLLELCNLSSPRFIYYIILPLNIWVCPTSSFLYKTAFLSLSLANNILCISSRIKTSSLCLLSPTKLYANFNLLLYYQSSILLLQWGQWRLSHTG